MGAKERTINNMVLSQIMYNESEENIMRACIGIASVADEKMNEDLFAKFIVRIDDVSAVILKGVNEKMTKEEIKK